MARKTSFAALFIIFTLTASGGPLFGQEPPSVRVPEGNGKPILVDGLFSPGEWDDALKIEIRPNLQLLLKKSGGFVFIGFKYTPFTLPVIDLFISPDAKAIRHLHVSAQLGERLLNDTPGADDDPEFDWGDTSGWYANEIRWSERKIQAMMKEGKTRDQGQVASVYAYDGFELQIRESKFAAGEWLVRFESPMPPDWSKPVVYPAGTDSASTRGWLKLILK
jgi:hypothetical protein